MIDPPPALRLRDLARAALAEDLGGTQDQPGQGDVTSEAFVPAGARAEAVFLAREAGVLCGLPLLRHVFGEGVRVEPACRDGDRFAPGDPLARVEGSARAILCGERVGLNFVQRLSGIATLARAFVDAVAGTGAAIYDTRKTTPLLRDVEKWAVRAGGARNHRSGLHDAVLVKDNHLAVLARAQGGVRPDQVDLAERVEAVRRARPGIFVEVEATTIEGALRALNAGVDAILLDNLGIEGLAEAVRSVRERARERGARAPALEASGGVRLETVRAIAGTGVDRISVGALTHSARALDIALELA